MKARITIGIPCYYGVSFETLNDYMSFAYYLGRRYQEYEFFLAIKGKSEQFRARNAIVKAMLQTDSDYLLMLDDDHVIDFEHELVPSVKYEFLKALIGHLEEDPKKGIVGALYVQRGGDCSPVIMSELNGNFYFLTPQEVSGGLQEVAVTGGGCMLLRRNVLEKIKEPWFEPESEAGFGTDIQICKKVRKLGYSVWCDTAIAIGHVKLEREVVLPSRVVLQKEEENYNGKRSGVK